MRKSQTNSNIQSPKFQTYKVWLLVIGILVVIWNLVFGCRYFSLYAQEVSKEQEVLFVAKKAFEDGFYEVSLGLLERFLKSYPESAELPQAYLLIGQCYFYQNKFLDALSTFEKLLSEPKAKNIRDALYFWVAEVHFKGNSFDRAASYYQKIIDEFPKSSYVPLAYYSLGWTEFQRQNFKESLKFFSIVEDRYPKEPQARDSSLKIIECLYNLKDYPQLKEKIKAYLKVYAKEPAILMYLNFYLAEANYYLDDFEGAVDAYQKVTATSDKQLQALSRLGLGWSYLKLKKYKEAESLFLSAE
ncbi:MAG: tetratricopeptide repeat protein, partial [Candidatus Omnitrophica bacterium]|nr:tetratricopeptide repeat protein [Candidatus Omnitrophota bacterium]